MLQDLVQTLMVSVGVLLGETEVDARAAPRPTIETMSQCDVAKLFTDGIVWPGKCPDMTGKVFAVYIKGNIVLANGLVDIMTVAGKATVAHEVAHHWQWLQGRIKSPAVLSPHCDVMASEREAYMVEALWTKGFLGLDSIEAAWDVLQINPAWVMLATQCDPRLDRR